jgi:hypothetical protein
MFYVEHKLLKKKENNEAVWKGHIMDGWLAEIKQKF